MTTADASFGSDGTSHRNRNVAAAAPANCATMNPGASAGRIPAKVSLADRASVTAGLAKDVDAVNQYAPVMYAPTANGTVDDRSRTHPQIAQRSPNVATNSLNTCAPPALTCLDARNTSSPNIKCATATPANAPTSCAAIYPGTSRHASPLCEASASVTAGLKCAPEIGPKVRMSVSSIAPLRA